MRNGGVIGKTVKIDPTLSQILLSVVDKNAYFGGNVCAWILASPQRFGPRIESFEK